MTYERTAGGRRYVFTIFAGYAALNVWNGPEVLCHGGHLKCGSALRATPETLPEIADKWLSQKDEMSNIKAGRKRK